MNTAVRAAVRLGLDRGHTMLGVRNGFQGLIDGEIAGDGLDERQRLGRHWAARSWAPTARSPAARDFYAIARNLEQPRH